MDAGTKKWLLAAGALGAVLGTSLLSWVKVSVLFATIGANAWQAGGIGPLAGVLAIALLIGAGVVLFAGAAAASVPPLAHLVGGGLLALLALLTIVGGSAGAGAFVTLVSTFLHAFAANGLRSESPAPTRPRRLAQSPPLPQGHDPAASRFCPSCGAKQDEGAGFCAKCGARLR